MDLSPQDAMSIVTEMKRTIGRDVNIIENTGVILASTNKTRIGTVHEGARQLIENGLDSFTVWADDPARGVQHGINLPVVLDGRIECVIGVTGDPAEVSVFGAVIRRLMEIMLESLRQRRRLAQMDSARDAFLEALFFENSLSPAELAERGQLLGFVPESTCTAVLLRPVAETGAEALAGLSGQTLLANIRRTDLPGKGSHCAILRGELAALLCGVGRREAGTFVRRLCAEAESLCGAAMAAGHRRYGRWHPVGAAQLSGGARGGARGVRVRARADGCAFTIRYRLNILPRVSPARCCAIWKRRRSPSARRRRRTISKRCCASILRRTAICAAAPKCCISTGTPCSTGSTASAPKPATTSGNRATLFSSISPRSTAEMKVDKTRRRA